MQVPTGYLLANGQSVLRATYPALWTFVQASGNLAASQGAKTKGQYGPGDGSTTFTIPDLGDEFIRGLPASGRTIGSSQTDETRSHSHAADIFPAGAFTIDGLPNGALGGAGAPGYFVGNGRTQSVGPHDHDITISPSGGPETRPRNIAYPFLIKT